MSTRKTSSDPQAAWVAVAYTDRGKITGRRPRPEKGTAGHITRENPRFSGVTRTRLTAGRLGCGLAGRCRLAGRCGLAGGNLGHGLGAGSRLAGTRPAFAVMRGRRGRILSVMRGRRGRIFAGTRLGCRRFWMTLKAHNRFLLTFY